MNVLETMKQALVALNESEKYYGSDSALRDAIQLIRTAIADMEKQEPVAYWSEMYQCYSFDQKYCDSVPLYTHPAPAVPEGER